MKRINYFILILSIGVLAACKKETPATPTNTGETFANGVFIVCEGNFSQGNAAVSFFHKDTKQVEPDVFSKINNYPLGDVFQSMYGDGSHYFLVVNNSQKIEMLDAQTFKTQKSIQGFNSPRYYLPFQNKAFVTDFGANAIWVLDADQNIKSKIPVSGWTEQMLVFNNELFVTKVKHGSCVSVIDPVNEKVIDSIPVGEEPQWIVKDKEDKLWVLTNAYIKSKPANLQRIDPATRKVLSSFSFPSVNDAPGRLKINAGLDTLYYLDNGVYKMGIHDAQLPTQAFVASGKQCYGLGLDLATGTIYASDAIGFTQRGIVFRYASNGTLLDSFRCGIGPGDFYFVK